MKRKLKNLVTNSFIWIMLGFGLMFIPKSYQSQHLANFVTLLVIYFGGIALLNFGFAIYQFVKKRVNQGCWDLVAVLLSVLVFGWFCFSNKQALANDYLTRQAQDRTIQVTKKNVSYKDNYKIPISNANNKITTANDTKGFTFRGTIATADKKIFCSIFTDSNPNNVLDTGNAVIYPDDGAKFGEKNVTLAAHTYAVDGWDTYVGFTALQKEINPGTDFYICDGNNIWVYHSYKKKLVDMHDTSIENVDNWKNKDVNPSGKPMLTIYDCYETTLSNGELDPEPTQRQVMLSYLTKTYDIDKAPANIRSLFTNTPQVTYSKENKVIKVKPKEPKGIQYKILFTIEDWCKDLKLI